MRTSCTHCSTHFNVPDKTLGKQAKCKSCGKMFVIVPASKPDHVPMEEVKPKRNRRASDPKPKRSPKPAPKPAAPAPESNDPLDALADAAIESGAGMAPVHAAHRHSSAPRGRYDEDDRGGRRRMAKGAKSAMGLGITSAVLAVISGVLVLLATLNANDPQRLVTLGGIALGLLAVAAGLGMMAVANGTSAGRQIRHARHPLGGRSEASTGILMGWIGLGLILIIIVVGVIWLSRNPDKVTFKEEINAEGQTAPKAPVTE